MNSFKYVSKLNVNSKIFSNVNFFCVTKDLSAFFVNSNDEMIFFDFQKNKVI